MPELPVAWQVFLALVVTLVAIALLIEPASPSRPDSQFAEVASLTF